MLITVTTPEVELPDEERKLYPNAVGNCLREWGIGRLSPKAVLALVLLSELKIGPASRLDCPLSLPAL